MTTTTTEQTTTTTTIPTGGTMEKKDFEPLQDGEYLVRMNRITEKKTKAGDPMLSVGFQVISKVGDAENETKSKNRLIFENYILEHKNPKVGEIARDRLGKYLEAVRVEGGLDGIGHDLSKLENYLELPFIAVVGVQESKNPAYGPSNKIKAFKQR
jgi:hypothetical protein